MKWLLVMAVILAVSEASRANAQDSELLVNNAPSKKFIESRSEAVHSLSTQGFEETLESPSLGSISGDSIQRITELIRAEKPIDSVSSGAAETIYDVILQPGHYGRISGAVGTAGRLVSERALVAYISADIARRLKDMKYNVLVVSADGALRDNPATPQYDGLHSRAFLAIHADGSPVKCKTGPSLAYNKATSPYAMHAIGWAISQALGYTYADFRPDGFTANEARYYMFSRVQTDDMSGLLEVGELTCEKTELALIGGSDRIAANVASALDFILRQDGREK